MLRKKYQKKEQEKYNEIFFSVNDPSFSIRTIELMVNTGKCINK